MQVLRSVSVALALILAPGAAQTQTTWHVDASGTPPGTGTPSDPYTEIQFAIDQAATVSGDTVLVLPGIYVERVRFKGKELRLIAEQGPEVTTIDGDTGATGAASTVTMDAGEGRAALLQGFTITGGQGTPDLAFLYNRGGGIYLEDTSPTIRGCFVEANAANLGCGIFSVGGSPWIDGCTFFDNDSFGAVEGGGAYLSGGFPYVTDSVFSDNQITGTGAGAAIIFSNATLERCTFFGNSSSQAAGLDLSSATATLSECHITENTAIDAEGGGLYVDGFSAAVLLECTLSGNVSDTDHTGGGAYVESGGSLHFFDGLVAANFSARGGGIACFGTLHVEDSVLSGNTAQSFMSLDGRGGGVWIDSSAGARLVRCVLNGNQAIEGPGGGGEGGALFGPAQLEHCTIAANSASQAGGGAFGGFTMINSIHWANVPMGLGAPSSVTFSDVEGGSAGAGNLAVDPAFWNGLAEDYHLQLGSPAIDAGDPFMPADPDGSTADMGVFPHVGSYAADYCTPGTSASGCQAVIGSSGTPSAAAPAGFFLSAVDVEGGKDGLFFFGVSGRQANTWGNGTSFQCVVPPVKRSALQPGVGTSGGCDGFFYFDLNAFWCPSCPKPGHNPGAGVLVQAQLWYRDPQNTSSQTTSLSGAREFQVQP